MIRVSIIGTGQIGFDLLHKILKLDFVEFIVFVGKRECTKQLPYNILYSDKSIEYFISNPNCCDVVFDCTDAYSAVINYETFFKQNIKVIDLTPSNIGYFYIPNITNNIGSNVNMVTCGGQVSIPFIKYLYENCSTVSYIEIVTQVSSNSAGMATRINIDKYIETTEKAIYNFFNTPKCKVILNINPYENKNMQTTIYVRTSKYNHNDIHFETFIKKMDYIQNYNVSQPIWISDNILMVNINVFGNGDHISRNFGNLDIINCSAIHALHTIHNNSSTLRHSLLEPKTQRNKMKVSDIVGLFLKENKIDTVFGMIGSANSYLYDSFINYNIKIVNVHNEQCAVIAAGAYYKTTGKLAISLITAGGGASNSITGIVSSWADSTPIIILTGQESTNYINEHSHRRMYGTQGFDITHMVSKITKYSKTIMESTMIQDELEKAYSTVMNGRKGPVLLDIPFNIQSQNIEFREWNKYVPEIINNGVINQDKTVEADEKSDIDIFNLLNNSKKPVFIAGNGIKLSNSKELFKKIIENIQIPTLLTWSGIDILDDAHPLYFGRPGIYGQRSANFILQKCDLLIVLGSRLTLPQTGYDLKEFARNAKIIMIDVDTTEFKSFLNVTCVHCDCNIFLKNISNIKYTNPVWLQECKKILNQFPNIELAHKDDVFINSYKMIDKISDYLKPDQIIVTDMGTALLSGHQVIRLQKDQTMFSSYGLGEMGYGLPAALGAAISSPEREILCLNCDGGMMLNLQELQTIIQHQLKIKIVIFNNDGYLMIKHTQKMLFNGKYNSVDASTGIVLPDYMRVADAFGYKKYQIKNWDDFYLYFPLFMDFNDGPAICEIFMPTNQDFVPKVKGVLNENGSIFAPPIEEMSPLLSYDTIKEIMGECISKKSDIISRN